jgi:hypothetical protein
MSARTRAPLSESLAEEVHHVKEDKARNYLHSKLTDTVSSDMLAYQKHDDNQSDEGLRRRHPLTHFQVHCKKRFEIFPSPAGEVTYQTHFQVGNITQLLQRILQTRYRLPVLVGFFSNCVESFSLL